VSLENILNSINDLALAINNHADALRITKLPVVAVEEVKATKATKLEAPADLVKETITLKQIQKALTDIATMRGKPAAIKELEKFGVNHTKELKPEDYPRIWPEIQLTPEERAELEAT
jgi:hypothetical protein